MYLLFKLFITLNSINIIIYILFDFFKAQIWLQT